MIEYRNVKFNLLRSDKILVIRMVTRDGGTFPEHYWVTRDEMKKDDLVLHDPQNSKYFCCKNVEDMNRILKDNYQEWFNNATPEEKNAIIEYTRNAYKEINAHLRWMSGHKMTDSSGKVTAETFEYIKELDKAIDNYELKQDITVHRVVDVGWLRDLHKHTHCKIYQDPAFLSTSVLRDPHSTNTESVNVHCIIQVPSGKGRGIFIRPISEFPEENEFLLRRDVAYLVESVNRSSSGHWVVKLRMSGLMKHKDPKGGNSMKKSEKPEKPISEDRMDRFTFKQGDGTFYASKEEFEEQCKKEGITVEWIGD